MPTKLQSSITICIFNDGKFCDPLIQTALCNEVRAFSNADNVLLALTWLVFKGKVEVELKLNCK